MTTPSDLKCPENSNSVTAQSAQVFLGYKSLQNQDNNITHKKGQKIPPNRKYYLCFQIDGESARVAQCEKSRALTKFIYSIFY